MKFIFESEADYDMMWNSVHESILYWKKVRQDAQGKICIQVDGTPTHYSEEEANEKMMANANILKMIEDTKGVDCYSIIIYKTLKMKI